MQDSIQLIGSVHAVIRDAVTKKIKHEEFKNNMVVTVGKQWFAKRLAEESANEMDHIAIGSGSTAASLSDTQLAGTELARVEVDSRVRSGAAVTFIATFGAGVGTGTVQEAGIFDGAAGTAMLARYVFGGPSTKGASDEIEITWTITVN